MTLIVPEFKKEVFHCCDTESYRVLHSTCDTAVSILIDSFHLVNQALDQEVNQEVKSDL